MIPKCQCISDICEVFLFFFSFLETILAYNKDYGEGLGHDGALNARCLGILNAKYKTTPRNDLWPQPELGTPKGHA